MTLLMRDEENVRKGMEKGIVVGEKRGMEKELQKVSEQRLRSARKMEKP